MNYIDPGGKAFHWTIFLERVTFRLAYFAHETTLTFKINSTAYSYLFHLLPKDDG